MAYQCAACAYTSVQWMGFCQQCGSGEPLVEVISRPRKAVRTAVPVRLAEAVASAPPRLRSGVAEVDRVLGGGFVAGGVTLLGGEPGVGKSTLLLQVAGAAAASGARVLVVTAEESAAQVGARAARLGIEADDLGVLAEGDVDVILAAAAAYEADVLIVDSIQTVQVGELGASSGGVAQVREASARLIRAAKERDMATVLVGHVTKDGGVAGPRLLEHMVDTVAYLEGEPERGLRLLRTVKNRFGATDVVGVFEMTERGLEEVADPSAAFVGEWRGAVPGSVVYPAVEGRRPVLVEVQALVAPTPAPQPRRSARGIEPARLHHVLAVLHRHGGFQLTGFEVFVGVTGGFRLREPGADLAVALAVGSSFVDRPLGSLAAWGEVGLTGDVRAVGRAELRTKEIERLGVERSISPNGARMNIREALAGAGLY